MNTKETLEMIPCPICGKPFPKFRRDVLGYNYCVNCSTEKPLVCRVEEHGEGDHTYDTIQIMKQEEAFALYKAEHNLNGKIEYDPEEETVPDYTTFEEQEEITSSMSPGEKERYLEELENEFSGMSERSIDELSQLTPLMDGDDEEEFEEDY